MVSHVALHRLPSNLTELRPQRSQTAAYASTAEATAPQAVEQQQRDVAGNVPPLDPKMLAQAVRDLSQGVQNLQRSLEFSIDETSGRTVIKVFDKNTQEIIRQIPEQHVLEMAARIDNGTGRLVKDEA